MPRPFHGCIRHDECKATPASLTTLDQSLRAQHSQPYRSYQDEIAKWTINWKNALVDKYASLTAPSPKADFDLREYFLNAAGNPDHSKTLRPLALPGVSHASIHSRAERIPGLEAVSGGDGEHRTLVIGWDRSGVLSNAARIAQETAVQRQETDENCVGQYSVEYPDLECDWDCKKTSSRFRIGKPSAGKLIGKFDFGVVKSVMHQAADAAKVTHAATDRDKSKEGDEDEDMDVGEDSEPNDEYEQILGSNKRKSAPTAKHFSTILKRKTDGPSTRGERRLHFVWRGRETGEGEIQNSKNLKGHLDFMDTAGTSFGGSMLIPFSGMAVIMGHKISGLSGPLSNEWDDNLEVA